MVLGKKVDGGDGIDVHARVVQQVPDVEAAGEDQIGPAAAVAVGIILLMRVERAAVPVVELLPGEFRLLDVLVLAPAEIADADRDGVRDRVGEDRQRQCRAQDRQQREPGQQFFHGVSFSVEFASICRASSSLRS